MLGCNELFTDRDCAQSHVTVEFDTREVMEGQMTLISMQMFCLNYKQSSLRWAKTILTNLVLQMKWGHLTLYDLPEFVPICRAFLGHSHQRMGWLACMNTKTYKTNSDWTACAPLDVDSYFFSINQSCTQRYYNQRFNSKEPSSGWKVVCKSITYIHSENQK